MGGGGAPHPMGMGAPSLRRGAEHGFGNVFVHGGDGGDELFGGSAGHGTFSATEVGEGGDDAGRFELSVEAHAVGEFVDPVDVAGGGVEEEAEEVAVGFVVEAEDQGGGGGDGGLDHVSVEGLRTHGIGPGIGQNSHGISRLNPSVVERFWHEDPQLISSLHQHVGLPPPSFESCVHHALAPPDQSFAGRGTDPVPGRRGFFQKLQGDPSHDPLKVGAGGLSAGKVGGDAERVDHIGGVEAAAVPQILWEGQQRPFRLIDAEGRRQGPIAEAVGGFGELCVGDEVSTHGLQDGGVEGKV
mmetsp:Transcript_42634/g.99983  ORF Transcript_42634/g.99983 Transcript_42634/m.99983 type:complete len:299 (-) Transcript_42634:587-1483(-)